MGAGMDSVFHIVHVSHQIVIEYASFTHVTFVKKSNNLQA